MRSLAILTLVIFHIASFARAGSITVVTKENNSCSAHGHCHDEVDFQDPHHNLNQHDIDVSDFAGHEDIEAHEHKHRHSPDEPEHSHPHEHSSFTHSHSAQFLTGTSYDLEIGFTTTIEFSSFEDATFQGPFLDSLFRPPIA